MLEIYVFPVASFYDVEVKWCPGESGLIVTMFRLHTATVEGW